MNKGRKETLSVRVISSAFTVLALAVFKPFGLEAWQWQAYVHLVAMFVLGIISCMMTEMFLKYGLGLPRSTKQGVSYIIHRNLWFQCINTPLVSLLICLYRHFGMSNLVESNKLSLDNYIETLLIIAFLSFAIGLYWRFKYRSRYLAAELEETRQLNEQLKELQGHSLQAYSRQPQPQSLPDKEGSEYTGGKDVANSLSVPFPVGEGQGNGQQKMDPNGHLVLTGTTADTIALQISDLLYVEAVGNYVKIYHLYDGLVRTDMLRATSKQLEDELRAYSMVIRCHRAFLVNLQQVAQIISRAGAMQLQMKHCNDSIPVSRSNMMQVKKTIKSEELRVKN